MRFRTFASMYVLACAVAAAGVACSQSTEHPPTIDPCGSGGGGCINGAPVGGVNPQSDATASDSAVVDDGGGLGAPDVDNFDVFTPNFD